MAGKEQMTQQPTGGKRTRFHNEKQVISKGKLPKQKGAGPSVPSKKRNRGCPSSGLSEHYGEMDDFTSFSMEMKPVACIEMDDSTSFSTEMKPMNDFIEMHDLTSFSTDMKPMDDFLEMDDFTSSNTETFGSFFDGQSATLGGEESIVNVSPHYKMPMDDFMEMDDFTSFCTEMMPREDFIEVNDFTSFSTEMLEEGPSRTDHKKNGDGMEVGSLGSKSHTIFNT